MTAPPSRAHRAPRSAALVVLLFVVALAGRFNLSRLDPSIDLDARLVGCVVLAVATFFWRLHHARGWPPGGRQTGAALLAVLVVYQLITVFWAPPGARVAESLGNLVALLVVVGCAAVIVRPDPGHAATVLLWCCLAAAALYAVGALLSGASVQGRYAAFGGGPNVFVRVQCLGVIAAVTVALARRRYALLLPIPLFLLAAVLSGSRGGLVALIGAVVAFAVCFFHRLRLWKLVTMVAAGGAAAATVWVLIPGNDIDTVQSRYSWSALQANDYSIRPRLLAEALEIFGQHPVLGGGLDSFYAEAGRYISLGVGYAHNLVVSYAAEGGAVALALFAAALLAFWRDGRPWGTHPPEALGCLVGAVYIGMASMFSGDYYDTRFMWIFLIVAATHPPARADQPGSDRPGSNRPSSDRPGSDQLGDAASNTAQRVVAATRRNPG
ncbi:MAG TPA: O-antigen ligase family protein [Pilimelia sp.]|nr:O-antigen ligase family protein [Pilimelia sp.]